MRRAGRCDSIASRPARRFADDDRSDLVVVRCFCLVSECVSGGGPGDACSLSPAWAQTSRRPQLALFQGRAEPWEQTQIRRIWCLFFVPLLLR
jgi:hypothetical protein